MFQSPASGNFFSYGDGYYVGYAVLSGFNPLHTLKERSGTGVGEFFFLPQARWLPKTPELPSFNPLHTLKERSGTGVGEFFFLQLMHPHRELCSLLVSIPCIGEFFFLHQPDAIILGG